jgi:glycosyltransferase involved in cell wall biosynthesis
MVELESSIVTSPRSGLNPAPTTNGRSLVARSRDSALPRSPPRSVSVVIPLLDQAQLLATQLDALARQTYSGSWELLVVDGGSTDAGAAAVRDWPRPDVPVCVIRTRRGVNHQRNIGASLATGEFLAFCDADDAAGPGWLDALVRAAPQADVVGGALELELLNPPRIRSWRDDEEPKDLHVHHGFLPTVPGGNCGVWAEVARDIGWDEHFTFGSSDIEFSWRAQMRSYRVLFTPEAVMHVRHRSTLCGLARQWFLYGYSGGWLYRKFRPAGMRPSPLGEWVGDWCWLLVQLPRLMHIGPHRAKWIRVAAFRIGRFAGSLRAGVIFP